MVFINYIQFNPKQLDISRKLQTTILKTNFSEELSGMKQPKDTDILYLICLSSAQLSLSDGLQHINY